ANALPAEPLDDGPDGGFRNALLGGALEPVAASQKFENLRHVPLQRLGAAVETTQDDRIGLADSLDQRGLLGVPYPLERSVVLGRRVLELVRGIADEQIEPAISRRDAGEQRRERRGRL